MMGSFPRGRRYTAGWMLIAVSAGLEASEIADVD
jgi:hypothetical protein